MRRIVQEGMLRKPPCKDLVRTSGLVTLACWLLIACSSSQPMLFHFEVQNGPAEITIEDRRRLEGTTDQVFELRSEDQGKEITLEVDGRRYRGRMDVFSHTELTRVSVVPIRITTDIVSDLRAGRAVSYVVFERPILGGPGVLASPFRAHDPDDVTEREQLIVEAQTSGKLIAVLDLRPVRSS